jgi:hypothetical protein
VICGMRSKRCIVLSDYCAQTSFFAYSSRQVDGTDTQSMDDLQDVLQKSDEVGDKVSSWLPAHHSMFVTCSHDTLIFTRRLK